MGKYNGLSKIYIFIKILLYYKIYIYLPWCRFENHMSNTKILRVPILPKHILLFVILVRVRDSFPVVQRQHNTQLIRD